MDNRLFNVNGSTKEQLLMALELVLLQSQFKGIKVGHSLKKKVCH